jgi:hypothetical protein
MRDDGVGGNAGLGLQCGVGIEFHVSLLVNIVMSPRCAAKAAQGVFVVLLDK